MKDNSLLRLGGICLVAYDGKLGAIETKCNDADTALPARTHFLLDSACPQTEESLAEVEENLNEAVQLAGTNGLLGLAANVRFELGNWLAERGDLARAISAGATSPSAN